MKKQEEYEEHFADRLKIAIKNESINSIAKRTNLSEGTIRNMLKGGLPRLDNLVALATALDVSVEWLATGRSNSVGNAQLDTDILYEVVATLKRDDSELKNMELVKLTDQIGHFYNTVSEYENKNHRQRLLDQMLATFNHNLLSSKLEALKLLDDMQLDLGGLEKKLKDRIQEEEEKISRLEVIKK